VEPRALRLLLARNIRATARGKKVSLTALADFGGVSRAQMFNILRCSSSATLDWIAKVASALDVEPWQLLAPRPKKESR
jgi:lambda repressor-like predicted transcriptional regulator